MPLSTRSPGAGLLLVACGGVAQARRRELAAVGQTIRNWIVNGAPNN